MAIKVTSDDFAYEVNKLLGEYQRGLYTQVEPVFRKTANDTRKVLRQTSPKGKTGKYARGWQYELKMNSRIGGGTLNIYNAMPGLTHLLEHGHAIRNGTGRSYGSVPARPHIEAANEYAQEQMMKNLELALGEFSW